MTDVTEGDDGSAGVTFTAFATMIGKSRPYVSKLVAEGRIRAPALTPERLILPDLARQQIAEGADPARARIPSGAETESTYARERARKTQADADRAQLELAARRGELVERRLVAETLEPLLRRLRDDVMTVPRDHVLDPVQAQQCEDALAAALERASLEILSHGGAGRAA